MTATCPREEVLVITMVNKHCVFDTFGERATKVVF